MTNITPEALLRHAIGFDPLYRFTQTATQATFPPHNIEKLSDDHYRLTLAVAGYSRDEITVTLHEETLTVRGERIQQESDANYVYRGIALRNFERQFKLGPYVEVTNAALMDGMLTIDLERLVPEAKKPKLIAIG